MTQEQFDNQQWTAKMKCKYNNEIRDIITIDFVERLVGLLDDGATIQWVRCENVELLN